MKRKHLVLSSIVLLASCARTFQYLPYLFGALNVDPIKSATGAGYVKSSSFGSLSSADVPVIESDLADVYSIGASKRNVVPSVGEPYLTVIPVDFGDAPASLIEADYVGQLKEAFFGNSSFNQYVSLAEYYDKASFHRLHVKGEVAPKAFRSAESYATLRAKSNASQTKAALSRIYNEAIAWYNGQGFKTHELAHGDPIYFVYLAPYSGMDGSTSSRSSMMWAFTINDPAPICWSSYYMMHPREDGAVDAHTFLHEFGHMLGLKDYYDTNSFTELSLCSPLGRMDMMDCSLGEQCGFSKMLLGWETPYVVNGAAEITLRPSSGNGDFVLLPIGEYNGTPFDEYILLDYYTPSYLNAADATLRSDVTMSLMKKAGVRAFHIDGRLGLFDDRAKAPKGLLEPTTVIGTRCLDFYADNSGVAGSAYVTSSRGFLAQALTNDENCGRLVTNFIASDHAEDLPYGDRVAHLRNVLFHVGEGIDPKKSFITCHKGGTLSYGFTVTAETATYATVKVFVNA